MKCAKCNADLPPSALFCDECAHPVAAASGPSTGADEPGPGRAGSSPIPAGRYNSEISRQNPGCLIFLIDRSGSMEEPMAGSGLAKKQVVADAINRFLNETILRCSKEHGVRAYFDIGVWSYGGVKQVESAFGADLLPLPEVNERAKRTEKRLRRMLDGTGGIIEKEVFFPIWFEPVADGTTPMHAAFEAVVGPVRSWLTRHPNSFPPIVVNLTDGAYSDANPAPVARKLMQMSTSDGNVLVFNCHISKESGLKIQFPDDSQAAGLQGLARELYDISSPLPAVMLRAAQALGLGVGPGARGYAFNADELALIEFLDVGTRAVQDRMERG
jgi:hypothetical protein